MEFLINLPGFPDLNQRSAFFFLFSVIGFCLSFGRRGLTMLLFFEFQILAGEKRASGGGEGRQEFAPKRVKMRDLESVLRLKGFFLFFFFVFFNFLGFCSAESLIFE